MSLDFQNGKYVETPLTLDWTEKSAVFTIGQAEDDVSLLPKNRTWTVVFRGWRKGCAFTVNGEKVCAAYDAETNTYTIRLSAPVGVIAVTNEAGLIHDNSDLMDKVLDCLTRAQIDQDVKYNFLRWVEDTLKQPKARLRPLNTRPDVQLHLGQHLYELLCQIDW